MLNESVFESTDILESSEVESGSESVDFSISSLAFTNVLLIGTLVFVILLFCRGHK